MARSPSSLVVVLAMVMLSVPASGQIYTRVRDGVVEATNVPDGGDFRLLYPGKGTLIHSRGFRGVYTGEFDRHIRDAALTHGVDEDLVRAVIQVESEYDPFAVSSKGAQGLMQLMPFTARRFGVSNSFDPRQNIFGGVQYLRFLLDLFQGDVDQTLAGYNAGENAVLRFRGIPPFRETQSYVRKVRSYLGPGGTPLSFAPSARLAANAAARPSKLVPARPAIYYRWADDLGRPHLADRPPGEGIVYTMIRALH